MLRSVRVDLGLEAREHPGRVVVGAAPDAGGVLLGDAR